MKNQTLIRLLILVLAPLLLFSCNTDNYSGDLSRADFEKIVIESDEFHAHMNAFESVRSLDDEVKRKFDEARKSGIVDDDDFSNFCNSSANARFTASDFLGKIGIANPEEFIRTRNSVFRDEINVSAYVLLDKFPKLKSYSPDEMVHLTKLLTSIAPASNASSSRVSALAYDVEARAACLDYAAGYYVWNLIWEGETYARTVYDQTRSYCYFLTA